MRVCISSMQSFHLETFDADADLADNTISMDMPIGNYFQFDIEPTCGLADENGVLDVYDNVRSFYSPLHSRGPALMVSTGFYRIPFSEFIESIIKAP